MNVFIAAVVTFIACFILMPILLGLARGLGLYTIVNEGQCRVYVLFGHVIAVLEERRLVMRAPHPTDRRQVVLTVTAEGRELVSQARRRRDAWLARRLKELTSQERAILRAAAPGLEKLSQA